jgi:hypothetical protein
MTRARGVRRKILLHEEEEKEEKEVQCAVRWSKEEEEHRWETSKDEEG